MLERMYKFSWDYIGDLEEGRPNLGNTTRVEVYRLFQYALRDVLEEEFGTEKADRLLYRAGYLAGKALSEKFIGRVNSLNDYVEKVKQILLDLNIGILRVESADQDRLHFLLTVAEDLDCSGLPDMGHAVCTYDEGFIAGVFNTFSGMEFDVKEIDCWCTGDRTCRFEVKPAC
ncbi:MAG: 4-vinyl reductase [Desulfovibrio sp.]|jgi:predicted hydrocarbon binding protein|nr:4-vinyl reductase [Desulfovibrio sp.]